MFIICAEIFALNRCYSGFFTYFYFSKTVGIMAEKVKEEIERSLMATYNKVVGNYIKRKMRKRPISL